MKMTHAVARRPVFIIVAACCLRGPLLCQAQGPIYDGNALIQAEAVVSAAADGGEFRANAIKNAQTGAAAQTATALPGEPTVSPIWVTYLTGWGRLCQMLPIFVVMALSFDKLRQVFVSKAESISTLRIIEFAVCLTLYCVSGPAVILLNKHIMKTHRFHFPIFLASLGNVFLLIVTRAAVAVGWKKLEVEHLSWDRYLKVIVPINVANFLAQTLGMYAFLYISVPEIQILKSMTIVMVLWFAWLLVDEKVSKLLVGSVLVIVIGVCVSAISGSDSKVSHRSVSHTLIGVTVMILSCVSEAAKTVISQVLIDKMSLFDGIYHSSPTFAFLSIVFVGCMEAKSVYHYDFNGVVVGLLVANALTTGVIVLSSFWFVKLAGALMLKIVTQARSVGLILFSVLVFGELCSDVQYVGYALTLVGMGMFDHARQALEGEAQTEGRP